MKLFLMLAVTIISIGALAQRSAKFSSQNYIGLLEGEQGSKFQLQTINGIKYKTWFAGIGTGIDWYYRRSIPAFMSLNKDFLIKGNRNFFIATDIGANFPWQVDKNSYAYSSVEKSIPGLYWGAGLGYRVGIGKLNDGILLQFGYSYKHMGEKVKTIYYYDYVSPMIMQPRPDMTNRFDYYLRRLSLKIGWNF
jgi:hypothetical protein